MVFPLADTLYMTRVHRIIEGDTFLKGFNEEEWEWRYWEPLEAVPNQYSFIKYILAEAYKIYIIHRQRPKHYIYKDIFFS